MARYTGPKRKLSRREGIALFAKDEKALTLKGAVPPGMHTQKSRRKVSDYGIQLREKQKAKRIYGILEKQFRRYIQKAFRQGAQRGNVLFQLLELRLDNAIFRLGFTPSRMMSRQLVSHGHILVNGKKVDIPSYSLKASDVVALTSKALAIPAVKKRMEETKNEKLPDWLERKAGAGKIVRVPEREEIEAPITDQLIIEYYSR